jgi:hypothetical protein
VSTYAWQLLVAVTTLGSSSSLLDVEGSELSARSLDDAREVRRCVVAKIIRPSVMRPNCFTHVVHDAKSWGNLTRSVDGRLLGSTPLLLLRRLFLSVALCGIVDVGRARMRFTNLRGRFRFCAPATTEGRESRERFSQLQRFGAQEGTSATPRALVTCLIS